MKNKEQIQQEIEKTLQSLDGVQRAEANPFLFTRIKARIQKPANSWEYVFSFISKPAIAIPIVILVMAVNGWALLGSDTNDVSADNDNVATSELANEYNTVASVNNYDYTNLTNE